MTVKNKILGIQIAERRAKARKYNPKLILEAKGDFYLQTPDYPSYSTFRMFNQSGENYRGVFYADSKRNYVFCQRHENIEDVLSTTEHENIHAAIFQCVEWEIEDLADDKLIEKYTIKMDDNEEHNMIRVAIWGEESFGE